MNGKVVAIIGAGNVGATAAYCIAARDIADVVLVDVVPGMPQSKGIDFGHAAPAINFHSRIRGANDYSAIAGADVVVHTAGIARRPGMDRMDLLRTNVEIARTAAQAIVEYAPGAILIPVANPIDIIAMVLFRATNFPAARIIGMAGVLDSTRFRYFIAEELGVWPHDVATLVLGGHGDSMTPLPRYTSVGGIALSELMPANRIESLVKRARTGGGEIVAHLKSGSAYYAPGASVASMVEAIITGTRRLEASCVYLQGEYGYRDMFLGVPTILGSKGVERIVELELNDTERTLLDNSAAHVREGIELLDTL